MSTTTLTAEKPDTLAASAKFRAFAVTVGTFGPLTYLTCLFVNLPMFTFHPATYRTVWGWEAARSGEGPAMYWYGWTATTVLLATTLGIIATMLPENITRRIPLFLIWLLPLLAVPLLVYDLKTFWLHP